MDKAQKIKQLISEQVKEFYQARHMVKKFIPGETWISYAGRVFDEKEIQALVDSSLDFWLTLGPHGKEFEQRLAQYIKARFCILANSGSSANLLALTGLTSHLIEKPILPGSEIITLAAGFPTTVAPIFQCNCIPVFVDILGNTKNIDPSKLEEALSPKTRAVMIAHTLGNPFDIDAVSAFCKKHDLYLIEDNCDALGSEYRGKKTGNFGHVATQSFYPAHHITLGEGGAVLTNDAKLKRAILSFRDWGRDCWCDPGKDNTCGTRFAGMHGELPTGYDHKYVYAHLGYNLKPLDLQAAIGCAQLEKLPQFTQARRKNFETFHNAFKKYEDYFILPEATQNSSPSWFGFMLTVRDGADFTRKEIIDHLESRKIQTRMLFGGNLIKQPALIEAKKRGFSYRISGDLIHTDKVAQDAFWFGVYPGLTQEEIEYMINTIDDFMATKHSKKVLIKQK
ncbi:MAG: lipopolysaccharide biosynthesis protein RfbH [Candidatus Omnitrophota bacterium]